MLGVAAVMLARLDAIASRLASSTSGLGYQDRLPESKREQKTCVMVEYANLWAVEVQK